MQDLETDMSDEHSETLLPAEAESNVDSSAEKPKEIGGMKGPEPTRYGDWEKNGRCIDF